MNARRHSFSSGFTLFEVAISLVLVTFGVISVLMVLPSGLQAQRNARMQIYACVAMENLSHAMVELGGTDFAGGHDSFNLQVETEKISNNQYMRRGIHDLETIAQVGGFGTCPLPTELAKRLQSENGEIERILSAGGQIYYNKPGGPPQSLVMGFLGAPQLNALPNHPCMAWPYYDNHPMAPAKWEKDNWEINSGNNLMFTIDDAIKWLGWIKFAGIHSVPVKPSDLPGVYDAFNSQNALNVTYAKWDEYMKLVRELVINVGVPLEPGDPLRPIPRHPNPFSPGPWSSSDQDVFPRPEWIWAISHLAHASAMVTGSMDVSSAPATFIKADEIVYAKKTYEACVAWVRRMSVTDPYNWGVARQASLKTAWDYPLLQYDLFPISTPPNVLDVPAFTDAIGDRSYRVVSPVPVTHFGQARGGWGHTPANGLRNNPIPNNFANIRSSWGNPNNFTLTRSFDPSERMRQVVFWSVDWQSYEDFESLPAPEHDASMCMYDSTGRFVTSDWWSQPMPERDLYWTNDGRLTKAFTRWNVTNVTNQRFDSNTDTAWYRAGYYMGIYGADRNGNGRFDRGSVPRSVRMRAVTIARFNIYDRILVGQGRF